MSIYGGQSPNCDLCVAMPGAEVPPEKAGLRMLAEG